ncbi:MAG: hypothetical protein ABI592_08885 [Acidobacteriota bacterium]
MTLRRGIGLVMLSFLAVAASFGQTTAAHPDRLGLEIEVAPMRPAGQGHQQYMVTTQVKELETGRLVFAPKVAAMSGTASSVEGGDEKSAWHWKASYRVDESTMTYTIEGSKDGEPIFSSTGTIRLVPPGPQPPN